MTPTDTFQTHRPRLFALAYRLLGSRSDAEDVVQDAWLRWQGADIASIRDPEGWLVTATTRLGLDRLRARRNARIDYVGPWLPEPLEIALDPDPLHDPAQRHARADEVSMAFLALLEQLGPDERAAFLLKDVFDYDYPDIAPCSTTARPTAASWSTAPANACRRANRASPSAPGSTATC